MPFIAIHTDGTSSEHACYSPALEEAKARFGSRVVYEGVRGMSVHVWPLEPIAPVISEVSTDGYR